MKKYKETLIFLFVLIILGAGLRMLELREVTISDISVDKLSNPVVTDKAVMNAITQLEQIARIGHDYLNGYVCGMEWGTALPPDLMVEEMDNLKFKFRLVDNLLAQNYADRKNLDLLLEQFRLGFAYFETGINEDDLKKLQEAHRIFHKIDYEIFDHTWFDDINVMDV